MYNDHKPLVSAIHKKTQRTNKRQAERFRQISEYTTDLKFLPGIENTTADLMSRVYQTDAVRLDDNINGCHELITETERTKH